MRRISAYLAISVLFLGVQASTKAQDILVPAGTLLRCTLDEPDFSSKTADIGDPVVCHLAALRQFGKTVFPRGSYLGGHLEADKEPGHFVGKGYLKIEFDRIGFPDSDIPVPSKIIAAKGYRVDKKGDIVGKGHATRDTVEWLIPPLWPWKILTLPAKGPRPALKGGSLRYVLGSGGKGSIELTEVDWRATSRLNAEPVSSTDESSSRRTYYA